MKEQCSTCQFWLRNESIEENQFGLCRKKAPCVSYPIGKWPITYQSDWCGDWEEKP